MSPHLKISSAHDDWAVPWYRRFECEYVKNQYPERYADLGSHWEHSVLNRISQFGITPDVLRFFGIDDISLMTIDQYTHLIHYVFRHHYDTAVISLFAPWGKDLIVPKKIDGMNFIELVVREYEKLGNIIRSRSDFTSDQANLVMMMEGADPVDELRDIDTLYDFGVRMIGLQYNHENLVANTEGLTNFGKEITEKIFDKKMIIDLAHSNPNVRKDIFAIAEKSGNGHRVFYTHGAPTEAILSDTDYFNEAVSRGIRPDEIERICANGGLIGFGATRPFHHGAEHLAQNLHSVSKLRNGINTIALGTDLGGVEPPSLNDIKTIHDLHKVADILEHHYKMSSEDIDKVMRVNVRDAVYRCLE